MCTLLEFNNQQDFYARATAHLIDRIVQLQKDDASKIVKIGLSGGSTPGPIYSAMAAYNNSANNIEFPIQWSRVLLFLIDDRFVPNSHKDSNQLLVNTTIVQKIAAYDTNAAAQVKVLVPETTSGECSQDVNKCVKEYGKQLEAQVGTNADIIILGMGPDGTCKLCDLNIVYMLRTVA